MPVLVWVWALALVGGMVSVLNFLFEPAAASPCVCGCAGRFAGVRLQPTGVPHLLTSSAIQNQFERKAPDLQVLFKLGTKVEPVRDISLASGKPRG